MFRRLHLLLAAVCVAVLFGGACSHGNCSVPAVWGHLVGTKYDVTIPLPRLHHDWPVENHIPPQCKKLNGVSAIACDYDFAPEVKILSKFLLKVHRIGKLTRPGHVTISEYCD